MNRIHQPMFCGALSCLLLCGVAHGTPIEYTAALSGAAEFPANSSPGTGFADVFYDPASHTLQVNITFSGLEGTTTAAHIHAAVSPNAPVPTAGVATQTPTFTGFPLGVTSGTYSHLFDLTLASSWNAAYITGHGGTAAGAEAALAAALDAGEAYLNIHSTRYTGGEIRGFLKAAAVPDNSATAPLLILGILGLLGFFRIRVHGSLWVR